MKNIIEIIESNSLKIIMIIILITLSLWGFNKIIKTIPHKEEDSTVDIIIIFDRYIIITRIDEIMTENNLTYEMCSVFNNGSNASTIQIITKSTFLEKEDAEKYLESMKEIPEIDYIGIEKKSKAPS